MDESIHAINKRLRAERDAARAELAVERRALELLIGELSDNYVFTNGHVRWVAKRDAEHWRTEARAEHAKEKEGTDENNRDRQTTTG